jgi:predicted Zn-dependent peptidase
MEPITVKRTAVSDGVALNYMKTDLFKASVFVADLLVPLSPETSPYYSILPQVLERGSDRYPTQADLCRALEELYASSLSYRVFKRGDWLTVEFCLDMLDGAFAFDEKDLFGKVMAIFGEYLLHPLGYSENGILWEEYVQSEKKNFKDLIRSSDNNRTKYALKSCVARMFPGEAFGTAVKGTPEFADSITAKALTQAYETLLRSSRVECFYVGGEEECRVLEETGAIFASRRYEPAEEVALVMHPAPAVPRVFEEDSESLQGKLIMGFSHEIGLWEKDYRAVPMMLEVLSGSPTSKLFMNVREKLSLCYYCSASPVGMKGAFLVSSGIENEKREVAREAILRQLEEIKEGKITAEEWENAKGSLQTALEASYDSPLALCGWYLTRVLLGESYSPLEYMDAILSVTREEVADVAKRTVLDTEFFLRGIGSEEEREDD